MNTIHLHGSLAKFGGPYRMQVRDAADAIRAIGCQVDGFVNELRHGSYRVVRGGVDLDLDTLRIGLGNADLHIIPFIVGAGGNNGKGKAILGIALIGVAFFMAPAIVGPTLSGVAGGTIGEVLGQTAFTLPLFGAITYGKIALWGLSMALGGISQLLAPQAPSTDLQSVDQKPSFLFNGPINMVEEGGIVPVGYGRFFAGSVVVSASIMVEELQDGSNDEHHKSKKEHEHGKNPSQV